MKNRQVLVALRKSIGNKKVMQRDVSHWATEPVTPKKGYMAVELSELGVWVAYRVPTA